MDDGKEHTCSGRRSRCGRKGGRSMSVKDLAEDLNTRFAAIAGKDTTEHLAWPWDTLATKSGKSLPAAIEELLYSPFFRTDRYAYRLMDVLAVRAPGDAEVVATLIDLMRRNRHGSVRALSARTLGGLKEMSAVRPMVSILNDARIRFPKQMRSVDGLFASEYAEIIDALAEIGDPTGPTFELTRLAEDSQFDAGIRSRAAAALAKLAAR